MSYRRALLTRWSRRDRLAVVVIAAVTVLLVGTTLVVAAAGAETRQLSRSVEDSGTVVSYDDPATARAVAPPPAAVLPVATVTTGDGERATVVGVPANASGNVTTLLPAAPPPGTVTGPRSETVRLVGRTGAVDARSWPRTREGIVPGWWHVARPETVAELGPTRALVVYPSADDGPERQGGTTVPLVGVPTFFVVGTRGVLTTVLGIGAGAGILVGVVVYSITRMTVADRRTTIGVLRATGLGPWRVLVLFAGRGLVLSVVGVVAGYAGGVIVTNAAVSLAVTAGAPTTLSLRVTPAVVRVIGPVLLGLVSVGGGAAALATLPAVTAAPAAVSGHPTSRSTRGEGERELWSRVTPELLDTTAVVPTAATLSVFVAMALVAVALGGMLAPLASAEQSTVVQSGAAHPVSSRVDADYARLLRESRQRASPEILVFSAVDGQVFLTRGANYSAFAAVTDARLTAGRPPQGPGEAVVGTDLATGLGIDANETLLLGGSNRPAVTRVRIVGVYRTPGLYDDQLLVPLRTARHLSTVGPDRVNIIRVAGTGATPGTASTPTPAAPGVVVTDVSVPATVAGGDRFRVTVALRNVRSTPVSRELTARVANRTKKRTVTVPSGTTKRVSFGFRAPDGRTGTYTVRVGDRRRTIDVVRADILRLSPLPSRGPPNASLRVRVVDGTGHPVANTTVAMGNLTVTTDADGRVVLPTPAPGTYRLTASKPGYPTVEREFVVRSDARRRLVATVTVTPTRPSAMRRPTAVVELYNPWQQPVTRRIAVDGPVEERQTSVTVPPGERRQTSVALARTIPGRHTVTARADGRRLAATTYHVQGDQRLVSVIAASGAYDTAATGGIGQAATYVLGNLEVLVATLVALTALVTVACMVAVFARAVHARRRTLAIHRACGATPRQVLALVLADVVRIASPATALALLVGYAGVWTLTRLGVFTAFGVTLRPPTSVPLLASVVGGALVLSVVGAVAATATVIRVPPTRLFESGRGPVASRGDDDG